MMNKGVSGVLWLVLALPCLPIGHRVLAADIADEVRATEPGPASENGGFLELGLTATLASRIAQTPDAADNDNFDLEFGVAISAGYRYERLFLEASESGFDGLNLGVTLHESARWSVDLLLANIAGSLTVESDEPPPPVTEEEKNRATLERDSLFIAAGTRVTGYFGDSIVQLRLVSDWYDDNGILGSARVGRQWQLGNWNLQAVGGARYYSPRFNNYLFGVGADEQTQRFPRYRAGSAWIPEVELGASMPVSRDWVYTTRLRFRLYPNSISNSPLVDDSADAILTTGLHYVF